MPSETEVLLPSLAPDNLVPSEQVPAVTPGLKIGQMNPHEFHVVYGGARARGKSEEESIQEVLNQRAMLEPAKKTASLLPKDADLVEFNNLREEDLTPEERLVFDTRVAGGQTAEEALADLETNRLFNNAPITGGPAGGGAGAGTPGGPPAATGGGPNPDDEPNPADPNQPPPPAGGGGNGNPDEPDRGRRRGDRWRERAGRRGASARERELEARIRTLEGMIGQIVGAGGRQGGEEDPRLKKLNERIKVIREEENADDRDKEELISQISANPEFVTYADALQLDPDMEWEISWIKTNYGLVAPIKIPKKIEDKVKYMRDALNYWEVSTGADLQANAYLERTQQLLEALQSPKYFQKLKDIQAEYNADTTPEGRAASLNKEIGLKLANEFVARKTIKEKHAQFEVSDSVKTNATIVRDIPSVYLDSLMSIPEIGAAFNVLETMYHEYMFSELETMGEVRKSMREEIKRRLADPYDNPNYNGNEEQYNNANADSYEWALRNAEILWNMWGNISMHDKLRYAEAWETVTTADPEERLAMGKVTFASNDLSQGASYNRRAFLMEIYIKAVEKQLGTKRGLVKGVDIAAGDYLTKEFRDKVKEHFENKYKVEFLERYGINPNRPNTEWATVSEQYAMLRAKADVERIFGVPIEIKGVYKERDQNGELKERSQVLASGDEEVVDIVPDITQSTDANGNAVYELRVNRETGNALREVVVRKKILRPRRHRDQDLMGPYKADKITVNGQEVVRILEDKGSGMYVPKRNPDGTIMYHKALDENGDVMRDAEGNDINAAPIYETFIDDNGNEQYVTFYDYDLPRDGDLDNPSVTRAIRGRVNDWSWNARVIEGADNSTTKFFDYGRTRWQEISFVKFYPSLTEKKPRMPMHNWSFDGLEYGDDVRAKLIAPGDVNSFTRNPRVEMLWTLFAMSLHKNNLKNGEAILLNFIEWGSGQITIDTGKPSFTTQELMNIAHEGAAGLAGSEGDESKNKSEGYDPLRIKIVLKEASRRIETGRRILRDFKLAQKNPATRIEGHPGLDDENLAAKEIGKAAAEIAGRTILGIMGIKV